MTDNRNTIIAVILSGIVLLGWQYFYNIPQMEKQRAAQQAQQLQQKAAKSGTATSTAPGSTPPAAGNAPAQQTPAQQASTAPARDRAEVIAETARVKIDTPNVIGSISLKGARIDDVALVKYRETVDPKSPAVRRLSARYHCDDESRRHTPTP